jgi:ATP-binding cassette subfamily F protein uup
MAIPPYVSLRNVMVTFGGNPVFDGLELNICPGERYSLVGRNGCGKSTLMKLIAGQIELDRGERYVQPGITIGYLPQQIEPEENQTVYDFVLEGFETDEDGPQHYLVDQMLHPLQLEGQWVMSQLSGGQQRRAALARSLFLKPDVLLLDEPTNHLDISAIEWLERYLNQFEGALLCISHDRAFLANISNRIVWMDRGQLRAHSKGYSDFERWSEEWLEHEAARLAKLGRKIEGENDWMHGGISARRKRNMRRVAELRAMREKLKREKSSLARATGSVALAPLTGSMTSRLIAEFFNVNYAIDGKPILNNFTGRFLRGDKVGILGKNGSGKSTFLKLVIGQLQAQSGRIRRGAHLEVSYFDQNRDTLDPDDTPWTTMCPEGGDTVKVGDRYRHVVAYLKDFLFTPDEVKSKVGLLSGGQANRLLLAKVLADPGNVLVLDEPTNDLDMDTLDMLQEVLADYKGTLFIVSHDRDFIDRIVTRTVVFEGDGVVEDYIGGYYDYLAQRKANPKTETAVATASAHRKSTETETVNTAPLPAKPRTKLSYKHQRALETMPALIESLSADIAAREAILTDADLYLTHPERFHKVTSEIEALKQKRAEAEEAWLEAEMEREAIENKAV